MRHPIQPSLPGVFIHVRDLARAVEFYSRILGVPQEVGTDFHNGIFVFSLNNGTDLILDANHADLVQPNSTYPMHAVCMFPTDDIDAAHAFLSDHGVEIITDIHRDPAVSFFNFKDPDGNIQMVCATPA